MIALQPSLSKYYATAKIIFTLSDKKKENINFTMHTSLQQSSQSTQSVLVISMYCTFISTLVTQFFLSANMLCTSKFVMASAAFSMATELFTISQMKTCLFC